MRHFLLFLLCIPFAVFAQTPVDITAEAGETQVDFIADITDTWQELIDHGKLTNLTNDELSLKWSYTVQDAPADWVFKLCDDTGCYPSITTNTFGIDTTLLVAADDESLWDLHLNHLGVTGDAVVTFDIYDEADLDNAIYSQTFNVTVTDPVSTDNVQAKISKLSVYPNPVRSTINITEMSIVDEVVIYNLLGKPVRTFDVQSYSELNLDGLQDGVYLIGMYNNELGLLKTSRILKKNARP